MITLKLVNIHFTCRSSDQVIKKTTIISDYIIVGMVITDGFLKGLVFTFTSMK